MVFLVKTMKKLTVTLMTVISPLTKSTYKFSKDILIDTVFTCFESFDKTQSSLRI